jgi:hypothetical protein
MVETAIGEDGRPAILLSENPLCDMSQYPTFIEAMRDTLYSNNYNVSPIESHKVAL